MEDYNRLLQKSSLNSQLRLCPSKKQAFQPQFIIKQCGMLIDQKNRQSYSLHRKFHSTNLDDYDQDHRVYRAMLSLFADNLNSYIRNYQDCMLDLQEHPRIRVSQDQLRYVEAGLIEICKKHISRISKESLYRNAAIRKGYQEYIKQYQPLAKQFLRIECENIGFTSFRTPRKTQNNLISRPVIKTDTDHLRLDIQHRRISSNIGTKTAKSQNCRTKSFQNNTYICKLSEFKAFGSNQLRSQLSPLDRIKTSYDRQSLQVRIRNGSFSNKNNEEKNNNDNADYMILMGEEVIVSQNRHKEEDWEIEQNQRVNQIVKPVRTFCTPRVLAIRNRGQNPQISFPKMELLKKAKNFWVSSVQPQGYRARSRQLTKMLAIK